MLGLEYVVVVSVLLAGQAEAQPQPQPQPASDNASLKFVSSDLVLVGMAYGLDAIDTQPRLFSKQTETSVEPGVHTVWYSCPSEPAVRHGSRITYAFEAGQRYELVCQEGKEAMIRPADQC